MNIDANPAAGDWLRREHLRQISCHLDDVVTVICRKDANGIPQLTREELNAIDEFNDWLDENFGPFE